MSKIEELENQRTFYLGEFKNHRMKSFEVVTKIREIDEKLKKERKRICQ